MTDQTPQSEPTIDQATLEGWVAPLEDAQARLAAIEKAFDYRGDVTIRTTDGRTLEGYLFDRRTDAAGARCLRMILKDQDERVQLRYDEVAFLAFTGRDTAAGKSWETWVRKYQEKKARGEAASIESEGLE